MLKIAKQLMEDAESGSDFTKEELLSACLNVMTEDQIYRMAISESFVETEYNQIDSEYLLKSNDPELSIYLNI